MKKLASCLCAIVALLLAGAVFVSCVDSVTDEPTTADGTFSMTVTATKGALSKALSENDNHTLTATWTAGDRVTVYNVTKSAELSGYLAATTTGSSTKLQGEIEGTITPGDDLILKFLSPTYTGQNGTLGYIASHCDYAEAAVKVESISDGKIKTNEATFVNQQAIVKFTLINNADNSNLVIPASTALTVNDGTNEYTVTPTSATNVLYVAIPATGTVNLSTTIGGIGYSYNKTGAGLEMGKYYEISVKMVRGVVNLANITGHTTLLNGDIVTGTLGGNYKISIADGATVTLDGVNINGSGTWTSGSYAGLNCIGNATIVLADGTTNTVKGFYNYYPGIHVPSGSTLTIQGTGTLNASSNGNGAGIGAGKDIPCGNITINGGTIAATGGSNAAGIGGGNATSCGAISITGGTVEATGGMNAAGIGGSNNALCGNLSITGGTITATGGSSGAGIGSGCRQSGSSSCGTISISGGTVTATGGSYAAGIGNGANASCGDISIENTVTSVTATKGSSATNSIGKGYNGSCGTVTIGNYLTLAISTKTNTNDTWTLTPISAPVGVVAVDLGLPSGTLWASCNVGATTPEGYGDYFAWGEVEPYYSNLDPLTWKSGKEAGYTWASYKYSTDLGGNSFSKYTGSDYSVLQPEDDAARQNWGLNWRMPTNAELQELFDNTDREWTTINGVNGLKLKKKTDASVFIFLPSGVGFNDTTPLVNYARGEYWSSTAGTSNYAKKAFFKYEDNTLTVGNGSDGYRDLGRNVRAVWAL